MVYALAQSPSFSKIGHMARFLLEHPLSFPLIIACTLLFSTDRYMPANGTPGCVGQILWNIVVRGIEQPPSPQPVRQRALPAENRAKSKVHLLAGAGLAVLSLLGLAVALALVRAFKR